MSYFTDVNITAKDSPSIDAFGRWRTSNPFTVFDSKQLRDSQPLFWDDQQVSGSGTSSSFQSNKACTRISVSTAVGKRTRQTFQRFNYQPGKSQLILITWGNIAALTGNTKIAGYGTDNNGLFFKNVGGVMYVVQRTYSSGAAVDTSIVQTSWNIDKFDGNGVSGVTLNLTKTQIGVIDFEWLGVGRVRMGFVVDGNIYYCHEFLNANNLTNVYMSTPNLPIRYSIENSGGGAADYFDHICSSVTSEGGQDKNGILRHADSSSISGLATGVKYALIAIRLKSTALDANILLENISMIATSQNDQAHWELLFNPTIAGTITYSDVINSGVQVAIGTSSNTITGGIELDGGFFTTSQSTTNTVPNALKLGASIAGTVDTLVLCCRPITNNISASSSITWRELS